MNIIYKREKGPDPTYTCLFFFFSVQPPLAGVCIGTHKSNVLQIKPGHTQRKK